MAKRLWAVFLALSMVIGLTACYHEPEVVEEPEVEPLSVRAAICSKPMSLDPARQTDAGGKTIVGHLFENLLRWEPDENGNPVLVPGQAESYTVEESYDGSITYTFTIRKDLEWSDGRAVTARDFLYAWQRLFDPDHQIPGVTALYMLRGYFAAYNEGDLSKLGVSAPDRSTFVITLDMPCAYFLEDFCAGAMTMPVPERAAKKSDWGVKMDELVTNGPYTAEKMDDTSVLLKKNPDYYDAEKIGPEKLEFFWTGSYEQLQAGDLDLVANVPETQLELDEQCHLAPELATYTLLLNNEADPFYNEFVRQALAAAIDKEAVVTAINSPTKTPATGIVPPGVAERGEPKPEKEVEEPVQEGLPPPAAVPSEAPAEIEEEPEPIWDFRTVGDGHHDTEEPVTLEQSRNAAVQLLAQGGYPNGRGFPEVEYLFVDSVLNRLAAQEIQKQWKDVLGIDVVIRGVSEDELRTMLLDGTFACAAFSITSTQNDPSNFLSRWATGKVGNLVRHNNRSYDLLTEIASKTYDTAARDPYLHDAEDILMQSCGVIPLYYFGRTYGLAEDLDGLLVHSTGGYNLQYLQRVAVEASSTETEQKAAE